MNKNFFEELLNKKRLQDTSFAKLQGLVVVD